MTVTSPHTAQLSHQQKNHVAACWESPEQLSPKVQVHRSSAEPLQNDMQITAYCEIRSCIYGHILVLNLHSMC